MASKKKVSNKTEAVMKLLTGNNLAVNPVLDNEFKQTVIESKNVTAEPVKAEPPKTERVQAEAPKPEPVVQTPPPPEPVETEVCISSELIMEILPSVLDRFQCCKCDRCFAQAMADALDVIPYKSVKVRNAEEMQQAKELKEQMRADVMRGLVRIGIARKALEKHV
ncbi:MAG: hypothetical protein IJZ72_00680 [Oscillospiraceae bacterium]|nr:hypothetical protein [Oscillospiraceae bacterium]